MPEIVQTKQERIIILNKTGHVGMLIPSLMAGSHNGAGSNMRQPTREAALKLDIGHTYKPFFIFLSCT